MYKQQVQARHPTTKRTQPDGIYLVLHHSQQNNSAEIPDLTPSESGSEIENLSDIDRAERELLSLQLPSITFFAIPIFIWGLIAVILLHSPQFDSYSPLEIIVFIFGIVFIVVPIFASVARIGPSVWRAGCLLIKEKERKCESIGFSEFLTIGWYLYRWYLSILYPPETIRKHYRWLIPIYLISIAAFCTAAIYKSM